MRLGIYGGAFSPVHKAHVDMAGAFVEGYSLDKLLIIPTGNAPHKQIESDVDPISRLEMCRLAFAGIAHTEVSDVEIRREGKSYTFLTLRELVDDDTEIFMLCGSDKIPTLEHWYCIEKIFELCTFVYVRRSGIDMDSVEAKIKEYITKFGAKIERLDACVDTMSSQDVRDAVAKGKSISELVPHNVEIFIKENKLYLNQNMNDKIITEEMLTVLREKAVDGMSDKRRIHTLAVEQMAMRIGAIYAPEKINILRAAALLHDVTKEIKLQGQLELCEKYGIEVSENDKLAPKTFHAKTAAKVIQDKYSEYAHEDVVSAVRWHTTGREGMSICEKIIYLADYIDDSRKFEDCVKLRDFFWSKDIAAMSMTERESHLRETLILSYNMTILNLLDENSPVAKDTFDARNELICERLKANNLKG